MIWETSVKYAILAVKKTYQSTEAIMNDQKLFVSVGVSRHCIFLDGLGI